jgi:uncharacterized protein YecE (DUF72 family)
MGAEIRIGTSGWHYKHWRGPFYPERFPAAKMLDFYIERFDTVELNNTFYRLPPECGVCAWRASTPDHFLFAVKGSRFLTHMKKLKDPELGLERFFERVDLLGSKLGPILFQLPPFWDLDIERLDVFLRALPRGGRYAFEFRNPTWHVRPVYDSLARQDAAFCPFDLAGYQSPVEITASWTYIRLHGPGGPYQGSYSDEALAGWARRIEKWRKRLNAVFVYFDNDMAGFAPANAATLKRLTGPARRKSPELSK